MSRHTVLKTDHYEGTLYKRSPYFLGSKLLDGLPIGDIELPDIFAFKKRLYFICIFIYTLYLLFCIIYKIFVLCLKGPYLRFNVCISR